MAQLQSPRKNGDGKTRKNNPANHETKNSGVGPAIILAGLNAYNLWNEHWEHWSHMPPLEERVQYSYQNIRTKNFTWGDGDKVCGPNRSASCSFQLLPILSVHQLTCHDFLDSFVRAHYSRGDTSQMTVISGF